MKRFDIYKDCKNRAIYLINNTFYMYDEVNGIEPVPNFLQSWFKKWIQENRTDLIIKTNFSDFTIVSTKENN